AEIRGADRRTWRVLAVGRRVVVGAPLRGVLRAVVETEVEHEDLPARRLQGTVGGNGEVLGGREGEPVAPRPPGRVRVVVGTGQAEHGRRFPVQRAGGGGGEDQESQKQQIHAAPGNLRVCPHRVLPAAENMPRGPASQDRLMYINLLILQRSLPTSPRPEGLRACDQREGACLARLTDA